MFDAITTLLVCFAALGGLVACWIWDSRARVGPLVAPMLRAAWSTTLPQWRRAPVVLALATAALAWSGVHDVVAPDEPVWFARLIVGLPMLFATAAGLRVIYLPLSRRFALGPLGIQAGEAEGMVWIANLLGLGLMIVGVLSVVLVLAPLVFVGAAPAPLRGLLWVGLSLIGGGVIGFLVFVLVRLGVILAPIAVLHGRPDAKLAWAAGRGAFTACLAAVLVPLSPAILLGLFGQPIVAVSEWLLFGLLLAAYAWGVPFGIGCAGYLAQRLAPKKREPATPFAFSADREPGQSGAVDATV